MSGLLSQGILPIDFAYAVLLHLTYKLFLSWRLRSESSLEKPLPHRWGLGIWPRSSKDGVRMPAPLAQQKVMESQLVSLSCQTLAAFRAQCLTHLCMASTSQGTVHRVGTLQNSVTWMNKKKTQWVMELFHSSSFECIILVFG